MAWKPKNPRCGKCGASIQGKALALVLHDGFGLCEKCMIEPAYFRIELDRLSEPDESYRAVALSTAQVALLIQQLSHASEYAPVVITVGDHDGKGFIEIQWENN